MFNFTANNRNFFMNEGTVLLNQFGHKTAPEGMNAIWNTFAANKAPIAEILSKHPNWDPDIMAIHLTEEYSTSVDHEKVADFRRFLLDRLKVWCKEREIKYAGMTYLEVDRLYDRLYEVIQHAESIPPTYQPVKVAGRTIKELRKDLNRLKEIKTKYYYNTETIFDVSLPNMEYEKAIRVREIIRMISRKTEKILDEDFASTLNEYAPLFFPKDNQGKAINKARFSAGMKTSKAIAKFFSLMGDTFVGYKDMQTIQWHDQSGNLHEREKDMGWNYYFSAYGDAINPIKVKRHTYISINPLDYLTMSFGNGWASCHTIDHDNLRPNNGNHTYSGCYQSGTLSYMEDGSSIIMYTTKEDIDESCPWKADKINRCVFNLGEEKFVQGRTYPDGRDNPNNEEAVTIASIFRNIFQRVICECWDVPNMWVIKRNNDDYTYSTGTHYKDYYHYSDTCTCLLKGSKNRSLIYIGHDPICPVCGIEHSNEASLHCGDDHECLHDENHVECARCGCMVDINDAIHDEDTGNYYCDEDCARERGCYYCDNVEEWHSDDVYYDDYDEEWFYDPNGEHIDSWDRCFCFRNEENAQACGFVQDEDGDWVRAE